MKDTTSCTVDISSDEYDILKSGSMIIPDKKTIYMKINNLKFGFTFLSEEATKESGARWETKLENQEDEEFLHIKVFNVFGSGLSCPENNLVHIANIDSRELFMCLGFCQLGGNSHLLYYTWYLKKKEE